MGYIIVNVNCGGNNRLGVRSSELSDGAGDQRSIILISLIILVDLLIKKHKKVISVHA